MKRRQHRADAGLERRHTKAQFIDAAPAVHRPVVTEHLDGPARDEGRSPRHSRAQLLERAGGGRDGERKPARERDTALGAQDFEHAELRRIFTTQQVFRTGPTSFERHDVCFRHVVCERIRPGARRPDESGQPPREVILDETSHEIPLGRGARTIDDAGDDGDEWQT